MRIAAILILWIATGALAQSTVEDGIRQTNVLPPEAYSFKFSSVGSVDYHGSYSASIPLFTVPGRGGMDYPVSVNYKAGITTDARATWVGLGWNLNPGSVTRVVNGIPDNVTGYMYHDTTENGAIIHYPPNWDVATQFPARDSWDYYLINIPGVISGLAVPVFAGGDSMQGLAPDYVFQEFNGFRISLHKDSLDRFYKPALKSRGTGYVDIKHVYVTGPDGTIYVFGLPLRSEIVLNGGAAGSYVPRFIVEYVSSWQLTAILSADCLFNYNSGDLLPLDNSGTWIQFEYNYPYAGNNTRVRNIRPLYFDRGGVGVTPSEGKDPMGLLTQTTYLSKITTPTHEVDFITSARSDISFLSPYGQLESTKPYRTGVIGDYTGSSDGTTGLFIKPLRLDTIKLFQRFPYRAMTSFVKFTYAAAGKELCRYGVDLSGNSLDVADAIPVGGAGTINLCGVGKTTLKEIMIADSASGQFYRFGYTDSLDNFNPPLCCSQNQNWALGAFQAIVKSPNYVKVSGDSYWRGRTGRMGYMFAKPQELVSFNDLIRNTSASAAWSLRTVEYPTGIVDTISYEPNQFDKAADQAGSKIFYWWDNLAPDECGFRVKQISSFDPITQDVRKVDYQYSMGHLPGLPMYYLRNSNPQVGVPSRMFLAGYSSADVEYDTIRVINSDGTKTVTKYSSVPNLSDDIPVNSYPLGAYDDQIEGSGSCLLLNDNAYSRGKILSSMQLNSQNQIHVKKNSGYVVNVQYSGYVLYSGFLPTGMSYYVKGKKLGYSYRVQKMYDSTFHYENDISGNGKRIPQIVVDRYDYDRFMQLDGHSTSWDSWSTSTSFTFSYQHPTRGSMFVMRNIINPILEKSSYESSKGAGTSRFSGYVRNSLTEYGFVDTVWVWHDFNGSGDYDPTEFEPLRIVNSFDSYGNPLSITNADNVTTNFEWNSDYNYARVTKQTAFNNGGLFTKRYTYNLMHLPASIEDENGNKTYYYYDGLGKLKKITGPDGKTLKTYDYNFRNSRSITWQTGGQ